MLRVCFCILFFISFLTAHEMSLEEKVGQLLIAHFNGESANEDAKILVNDVKVGGIIYYNWSNGLSSKDQVTQLSKSLQELTKNNEHGLPLFIAVDQEGGIVNRLSKGFTHFPSYKAFAMTDDPHLAYLAALQMGKELTEAGVNMNFAPVVDINSNPKNPIIGIRSFGETPSVVVAFGKAVLDGFKEAGILSTLKHFPGHGDVEVDSHLDLPILTKSLEQLEKEELVPFMTLSPFADLMMTAHMLVPALDEEKCVTISEKALNYLRSKGFDKVVITDSLVMEGLLKRTKNVEEAAILAINAGSDIVLLGGRCLTGQGIELTPSDVLKIHNAIVNAVKKGDISELRIDEAVKRVLGLKKQLVTWTHKPLVPSDSKLLCEEVAAKAIRMVGACPDIDGKQVVLVAPRLLESEINLTTLSNIPALFFENLNPSEGEIKKIMEGIQNVDMAFVCSYNAWKNVHQEHLIQTLIKSGKPVVIFVTRDPLDALLFKGSMAMIQTFSPTASCLEAISKLIFRKAQGPRAKIGDH